MASTAAQTPQNVPDTRPNAAEIAEEIDKNSNNWQLAMKIPFWAEIAKRKILTAEYRSMEEFFARWKIAPSFQTISESVNSTFARTNKKGGNTKLELDIFFSEFAGIFSQAKTQSVAELRKLLRELLARMSPDLRELFPTDLKLLLYTLHNKLRNVERCKQRQASEMSWDLSVYSAMFHDYFEDTFYNSANKSISKYLTNRIANSVDIHPDFVLFAQKLEEGSEKLLPFLVCEYGEEEHASNHKDLLKLMETLQDVLSKRYKRYPNSSNSAYGVLCGGSKLTVFEMQHNRQTDTFACAFLANNLNDMYTAQFDVSNVTTILKANVSIMLTGKLFEFGPAKRGPEKASTGSQPSFVGSSAASVGNTGKKKKTSKKKCSTSTTSEDRTPPSSPSTSNRENDLVKRLEQMNLTNTNNAVAGTNINNNNQGNEQEQEKKNKKQQQKEVLEALAATQTLCNKYTFKYRLARNVYRVDLQDTCFVAKFFTSKDMTHEERILQRLSDQFLKPVDCLQVTPDIRCLIFPYIEDWHWTKPHEYFEYVRAIVSSLAELHEKHIAHCDIKYSNVVFGEEGVFLIDFDLALENPDEWEMGYRGTFGYRAPETIQSGILSYKTDIYSLGIFLFELAMRCGVYDMEDDLMSEDETVMAAKIRHAIKKFGRKSAWNAKIVSLINKCMNKNPDLRPTAKELLLDPLLAPQKGSLIPNSERGKQMDEVLAVAPRVPVA